jgi:hypothetical protein
MDFAKLTSIPAIDAYATEDDGEGKVALREAVAILDAISFGELFAALPTGPGDRVRHQTGIALLDILRERLKATLNGPV